MPERSLSNINFLHKAHHSLLALRSIALSRDSKSTHKKSTKCKKPKKIMALNRLQKGAEPRRQKDTYLASGGKGPTLLVTSSVKGSESTLSIDLWVKSKF